MEIQSAALPYRLDAAGAVEILLVTTAKRGRWSIPKGRVPTAMGFAESAAKEAYEEAGVLGEIRQTASGSFRITKRKPDGSAQVIEVWVYLMPVTRALDDWPEKGRRRVEWFPLERAKALVGEPAVAGIMERLAAELAGA
ncbi:MAG: NUDIX hydrolase [Magnetospirillum sp.]|nr:NUDIX hydrolase [Magnetospirillum sp.]